MFICKQKVRSSDQPASSIHRYQSPYGSLIILTLYNITDVFLSNVKDKFNICEYYGYVNLKLLPVLLYYGNELKRLYIQFSINCLAL